jgi:predicted DNA-binding protein
MNRVNFHLTDEQRDRLRSLSERTGLTVAELIRRAVDAYLEKEEKKAGKRER